jgi:hypothetical protein
MRCEPEGEAIRYESERTDRRGPAARLTCRYWGEGASSQASPGSLEAFLTDRYCLYAERGGRLMRGEIHHQPWRLRRASWEVEACEMALLAGVELNGEPESLLIAEPLEVVAWTPRPV